MQDILDKLAADVKSNIVETCAKVAEIHLRKVGSAGSDGYDEDVGYNTAVRDIAAKLRQLNIPKS